MKKKITLISAVMLGLVAGSSAQGLLSIGQFGGSDDFESRLPFTTTIGVDFGWDSNPTNAPSDESDSSYTRVGINTAYANGSRTTNFRLNAGFSTIYYFDEPPGLGDDTFYTARVGFDVHHRVNRRLTVGDSFYISYEIEPDNAIGTSASRRLDQYLYGYNSLWASYAWSRRVSTVGRYTIYGIDYDDFDAEDRLTHTISGELRYVLNRLTTLVGEYRYAITDYETADYDHDSHYFLVGADHQLSPDLRGTWRVGAEYRQYDSGTGDEWRPYLETSLRYALAERTSLVWFNRLGYEDSELSFASSETRFTFRSSLSVQHQITKRLRTHGGISYTHDEYEGGVIGDVSEDAISLSLGIGYRIWTNWDLNAGYHFTYHNSDTDFREYDRHRISAGLSVTF